MESVNIENIIEAMSLRGYEQIDMGDGKISFRREDDYLNMGDTKGWTFQYDNWEEVRETLRNVPLWEAEETTKQIKSLIGLNDDRKNNMYMQFAEMKTGVVEKALQDIQQGIYEEKWIGRAVSEQNPRDYYEIQLECDNRKEMVEVKQWIVKDNVAIDLRNLLCT